MFRKEEKNLSFSHETWFKSLRGGKVSILAAKYFERKQLSIARKSVSLFLLSLRIVSHIIQVKFNNFHLYPIKINHFIPCVKNNDNKWSNYLIPDLPIFYWRN